MPTRKTDIKLIQAQLMEAKQRHARLKATDGIRAEIKRESNRIKQLERELKRELKE